MKPPITSDVRARQSRLKFVSGAFLALGFTALGANLALGGGGASNRASQVERVEGALIALVFGLFTIGIIRKLSTSAGDVIVLSSAGFHDKRLTRHPVPWAAIRSVDVWKMHTTKVITLDIDPAAIGSVEPTLAAKMFARPVRLFGAGRYCVATTGLTIRHAPLLKAMRERVAAAKTARGDVRRS
jgi:hypothetical protein